MNGFLLSLLALTHVLTVCGGAALLFRLTRAGRCGRLMSAVWTIVLLLALIPLRLPEAWLPMSLFGETGSDALIELSPTVITAPPAAEASEGQFTVIEHPAKPAQPVQIIEAPAGRSAIPVGPILFAVWLGGAAVMLMLSLRRSRQLSTTLRTCSIPCEDDETLAVFVDLAHRTGLRRLPELRVLDAGIPIPPCTAGFFAPCIYLPAELPTTHDSRAAILAHELCHIRRRDIWRKLFALAVCSAHWFNPLAHVILPRVYEDLEPACDRDALRLLGGEPARIGYMQTLLEVAAQLTVWQRGTLVLGLGSQKQQIERRFTSMKKTRLNKLYAALALLLVCVMALGAAVIFTACTPVEAAADPREALTPLTERIVRYQYDLAPGDEITLEMLEGITSLKLSVSAVKVAALDNQILVNFTANHVGAAKGSVDALLAGVEFHQMVPKRFFEETIIKNVPETEFQRKKVEAFYLLVDLDTLEHEREKAEKKLMYPGIENCPCYIFDPTASETDLNTIFTYLHDAGVLAPQLLDSPVIDTAPIYAAFPNLTTLELVGLTTVTPTTAGLTPLVDRIVRYYYNLGPNDIITDEMLAGVTSIKLEVSSIDTNIESLLVESMEQDKTLTIEMMELPADSSESLIASMKKFIASSNDASAKRAEQRIELGEVLEDKTFVSFNVNYADAAEDSYEALVGDVETFKFIPQRFFEKAMLAQVTDDWTRKKVQAFYTFKDASIENERLNEMLAMFPGIDKQPTYIADPSPTIYDLLTIYYHLYEYGILDPQLLDSTTIDTAQFAVFPNLATLELVGLTEAK